MDCREKELLEIVKGGIEEGAMGGRGGERKRERNATRGGGMKGERERSLKLKLGTGF